MATWILERDVFSESCFNDMVEHFKKNNIPYHIVRVIPFVHEIEGKVPEVSGPVVCYGSIGIQKLARKHGWTPGIWTNDNFNYEAYNNAIGELLLNNDCVKMPLSKVGDYLNSTGLKTIFLKPNADTKEFAGCVMEADEFHSWHKKMLDIGYLDNDDFDVVVSEPKRINREWRVAVINGKIASASLYRQYQMVKPEENIIPEVEEVVYMAHAKFVPADVYIIDVAETENGFKVIEYNTFNSAGLYKMDVGKIIDAIEEMEF
jgi:hypothetical protein